MYQLLWAESGLATNFLGGINETYGFWASRSGFGRQVGRWEAEGILETVEPGLQKDRIIRLTQAGRLAAMGGRDPEERWARHWDRKWRLILFDIPRHDWKLRKFFIRGLRECGCGCLQGSVWISPDIPDEHEGIFKERGLNCSHLILLNSNSKGRAVDSRMVRAAWDFERINHLYAKELAVLRMLEDGHLPSLEALLEWGKLENEAWHEAVTLDPLLPEQLVPRDYLGKKVWRLRHRTLRVAGELMAELAP